MKACISFSGGLDSTCLLVNLLSKGYEVKCYSFKYGQRHEKIELEKAQKNISFFNAKNFKISHQLIDLTDVFNESTSSLHSKNKEEIPQGDYTLETQKSTVVENRNVIFASVIYGKALSWAKKTNSDVEIFLGVHANDNSVYLDCREESRLAAELCFRISNWDSEKVSYQAPFIRFSKSRVLKEGIDAMYNLDFKTDDILCILKNTHSCYDPDDDGRSCGRCGTCIERIKSFIDNRLDDPIVYV